MTLYTHTQRIKFRTPKLSFQALYKDKEKKKAWLTKNTNKETEKDRIPELPQSQREKEGPLRGEEEHKREKTWTQRNRETNRKRIGETRPWSLGVGIHTQHTHTHTHPQNKTKIQYKQVHRS